MAQLTTTPKKSIVSQSPLFYGWIVWAVATIGMIATSPAQSFTVSLFIDHYIDDFAISRTTVSTLYSVGTALAALSLTWVGRQIDRYGNRRTSTVLIILFVTALVGMSFVAGPIMLFVGFVAIRGLGQGSLGLSSSTVVAQWFRRRRGFVLSISIVLWALFQRWYIPFVQALIDTHGWRSVWLMLAAAVSVIALPLTVLLIRDRPEDYGLAPDGGAAESLEDAAAEARASWTLRQAMRTPIFWVFISGRMVPPTLVTGIIFHQISLFAELGHSAEVAATTYGSMALISAGASLAFGLIIDRFRPQLVMAVQLTCLVGTSFFAIKMTSPVLLLPYAILLGLTMGSGGVFDGAVWANVFGRKYQGEIRGFVSTSLVMGTAIGPIVFGLSYDVLGSYNPVLWLGIAVALIPALLSFFVRLPEAK